MHFFQILRSCFTDSGIIFWSLSLPNLLSRRRTLKRTISQDLFCEVNQLSVKFLYLFSVASFVNQKKSISSCKDISFSYEIDHSIVVLSNWIPNIVPKVLGPNAFSFFGQGGARRIHFFTNIFVSRCESLCESRLI
jgi:hypothetical protein